MVLAVPTQPLWGSPNPAYSPGPHFSSPAALLLAGTVEWVLAAMPCTDKPHEKVPLLQVFRECLLPDRDDKDQGSGSFSQTRLRYLVQLQVTWSGKRSETKICTFDCEPQPLLHTIALPLCFLTFSSLLHSGSKTYAVAPYVRIKDDPLTPCTVFCMFLFSLFLADSL